MKFSVPANSRELFKTVSVDRLDGRREGCFLSEPTCRHPTILRNPALLPMLRRDAPPCPLNFVLGRYCVHLPHVVDEMLRSIVAEDVRQFVEGVRNIFLLRAGMSWMCEGLRR